MSVPTTLSWSIVSWSCKTLRKGCPSLWPHRVTSYWKSHGRALYANRAHTKILDSITKTWSRCLEVICRELSHPTSTENLDGNREAGSTSNDSRKSNESEDDSTQLMQTMMARNNNRVHKVYRMKRDSMISKAYNDSDLKRLANDFVDERKDLLNTWMTDFGSAAKFASNLSIAKRVMSRGIVQSKRRREFWQAGKRRCIRWCRSCSLPNWGREAWITRAWKLWIVTLQSLTKRFPKPR